MKKNLICNFGKALAGCDCKTFLRKTTALLPLLFCCQTMSAQDNNLKNLRDEIDSLDNALIDLLDKRMKVCREVGMYKKEHNVPVLQNDRFHEILEKRTRQGEERGMDGEFIRKIFCNIHEESCRQQEELINTPQANQ